MKELEKPSPKYRNHVYYVGVLRLTNLAMKKPIVSALSEGSNRLTINLSSSLNPQYGSPGNPKLK